MYALVYHYPRNRRGILNVDLNMKEIAHLYCVYCGKSYVGIE